MKPMKEIFYVAESTTNKVLTSGSPESVALGKALLFIIAAVAIAIVFFSILSYVIARGVEKGMMNFYSATKKNSENIDKNNIE